MLPPCPDVPQGILLVQVKKHVMVVMVLFTCRWKKKKGQRERNSVGMPFETGRDQAPDGGLMTRTYVHLCLTGGTFPSHA